MKKLTKYERAVLIFLISLQILILTSNITDGSNNGSILNSMLQETKDLFIEYREKVKCKIVIIMKKYVIFITKIKKIKKN